MDLLLKSKRAIVLGATRGIGRAIAEQLAEEGAALAICARSEAQVKDAVAALEKHGGKVLGEAIDIANGDALKAFVGRAADSLGGIDIVISNASALNSGNTRGRLARHARD